MNKILGMTNKFFLVVFMLCMTMQASAQRIALKTNVLYWAAETPNIGVEFRINRRLTANVDAMTSFMDISKVKVKGEALVPELRYWLSARPQTGHFLGVMGLAAHYDLQHDACHHDGDALGFGPTYGYSLVLGKHWSLEATVGLGMLHRKEKYYDTEAGQKEPGQANKTKWMAAPLKAGVSFVYILK